MKLNTIIACAICVLTIFTACEKDGSTKDDPCKGIKCLNGGTCINGACSCPAGYEGTDCGTLSRAKFIGTFKGTVITGGWPDSIEQTIVISENADKTKLNITGLIGPVDTLPLVTCTMRSEFYCRIDSIKVFDVQGHFDNATNKIEVKFSRYSQVYISIFKGGKE